jgi:hypothetical protein
MRDQISAYMKLPVATETTGGPFHRIRSSAAVKCAGAPQVVGFSHGLGQLRTSAETTCAPVWRTSHCAVPTKLRLVLFKVSPSD